MSSHVPVSDFASRFLPSSRLADDSYLATCPACASARSLRIDVDNDGAFVACLANVDTDSPCDANAFARALHFDDVDDWHELLASVFPDDALIAQDPSDPLTAHLLSRAELASLPVPEPLIADTILRNTLSFIAGPPASGKSWHLLAWAASVATGTPWNDRAVERGRVLYLAGECVFGFHDRLSGWEHFAGSRIDENLDVLPLAVQIVDDAQRAQLVELVRAREYDLVIVDTLSRSSVGFDENGSDTASRLVAALDEIRAASPRAALVVAHHSAKSGSALRGSSALEGAADVIYKTEAFNARGEGNGPYELACVKHKYAAADDVSSWVYTPSPDGSGTLLPVDDVRAVDDDREGVASTWRALLNSLSQGQTFTRSEAVAVVGKSRRVVSQHITELLDVGALVLVSEGRVGVADRLRLDMAGAAAHELPTERFDPLRDVDSTPFPSV